ncbi:PD-(D/E)XK nuclease family protein [Candidatus Daviesbacteria bacterium]|nr:PD-(D/E)XK nuclease family protein [Candidatus Daviesbacteria bacterium]
MIQKQEKRYVKNGIWLSHTSLHDFLKCPRSFYLKNIYRDKKTGYKIQIASPYLTLGSVVHDMIKWFLEMQKQVTKDQLLAKFDNFWLKYQGKRGGFASYEEEEGFKSRGRKMLEHFYDSAKILGQMIPPMDFPKYYLDEDVVLFGNLDYMEELPDGSLHIIDFKTGQRQEEDPLQLHIYAILAEANLGKSVSRISYWYVDRDQEPKEAVLDSLEEKLKWLKKKGQEVKMLVQSAKWVCVKGEEKCRDCREYEAVLEGKGEFQFVDDRYKKMVYFLDRNS